MGEINRDADCGSPQQRSHIVGADDVLLEQEVDDACRVDTVDDRRVQLPELELQQLVRL